jgi:uncharacterized protein YkwD
MSGMKTIRAVVVAALIAAGAGILLPAPAAATIDLRCEVLVRELNRYRDPNVRIRSLLCDIARARSQQNAAGYLGPRGDGHNIAYVVRRLDRAGVCWKNVGEAIGWTTLKSQYASVYARRFVELWRASPEHWPMLSASRYDRAGGGMTRGSGRMYAVLIVLDTC